MSIQGAPGSRISGGAVLGKRPPGRPRGHPKSGGRQKDIAPQTSAELRAKIIRQGQPVETLIAIAAGRVREIYDPVAKRKIKQAPTLEQSQRAAEVLLRKILPDLNAVAATVDATLDAHLTTEDIANMSPVEKEQRLIAIGSALGNLRAVLDPPLTMAPPAAADPAPAAHSGNGAAAPGAPPTGGSGHPTPLGRALAGTPAERDAEIALIKAQMTAPQGGSSATIARLEAEAAAAAAAGDADPDDEASIEVARIKAQTMGAGKVDLFERVPPRVPERPETWATRLARSRRDADGN